MRMAANPPETFPQVAKLGLPLFIGLRDLDIPLLRGHLKAYREAWRESAQAGPPGVFLRNPGLTAPPPRRPRDWPPAAMTYFLVRLGEHVPPRLGHPPVRGRDR